MGESQSPDMKSGLFVVVLLSVAGLQNVDAASFARGTRDTLATCPAGHAVVGTQSECETAAADLELTFGSMTYSGDTDTDFNPKGCFLSNNPNPGPGGLLQETYFNTHATGAANAYATPICSDAPFVLGAKNTNGIGSCPDYYSIVDTESACEAAADALELNFGSIFTSPPPAERPKGCFSDLSCEGEVLFNTHATGAANDGASPICARDASTEETLTCQYIKTEYKNQNCCGNPQNPFVLPSNPTSVATSSEPTTSEPTTSEPSSEPTTSEPITSGRRLQSTSPSHGGRYDPHQAVDQVVEEFTNWNTLLNQGLINVQEYSARKTRLLESLV